MGYALGFLAFALVLVRILAKPGSAERDSQATRRSLNIDARGVPLGFEQFHASAQQHAEEPRGDPVRRLSLQLNDSYYKYRWTYRRAHFERALAESTGNQAEAERMARFAEYAERQFRIRHPRDVYGRIPEIVAYGRWIERWLRECTPREASTAKSGTVYVGTDDRTGRSYVGQTMNPVEFRYAQHRESLTGPFKEGATAVSWSVLEVGLSGAELDSREAYWIGRLGTFATGLNDTRGNDLAAYRMGESKSD